jgi:hypothetical protein
MAAVVLRILVAALGKGKRKLNQKVWYSRAGGNQTGMGQFVPHGGYGIAFLRILADSQERYEV